MAEHNPLPNQAQQFSTRYHSAEIAALKPQLQAGLKSLELKLNDQQVELILGYVGLLHKWGVVYNLTAIRLPNEILVHHVLDCLAIVKPVLSQIDPTARVLDVGSGAGLPAVMLALACPGMTVVAVDAVAKKTAFIQQVAGTRLAMKPGGRWLAMKGKVPEEEIRDLPKNISIQEIEALDVPSLDAERCLIWLTSVTEQQDGRTS